MNLNVGISDWKVAKPPDVLVTYALGSCVGICLYDKRTKIGGLSHIMLPNSTTSGEPNINRMKFADTAIPDMIKKMVAMGALQVGLTAKIAGGALMFKTSSDRFNIGERNVESVKSVLQSLRIPLIGQDVGLNYGRTVFFYPETGAAMVKSATKGERKL
ncbi:MAG: chemotaxis protein CheD [Oscillospiraceae bacterium]|nr:chemotaxis protein CheD [Oscillospiraceae bacterium]